MPVQLPEYLSQTDAAVDFVGTRVSISDFMHLYNQGYSAEMIALEFPSVPLAIVHRFIAFYLDNRGDVEGLVAAHQSRMEQIRAGSTDHLTLADLRRRLANRASVKSA